MGKKICVYAICKNEAKHIKRWIESVKEADYIAVLDTGSEDESVELLKSYNVIVEQKIISPWRFDVARNESMKLIPPDTDICVCVDLDECFEKGWREKLESCWKENTKRARYRYTWNFLEDGREGFVFFADKIHSYGDFYWKYPVHEVLCSNLSNYEFTLAKGVQLNHYADHKKSRGQYLKLLEMSVEENPEDDRNVHYLGREYMFHKEYEKAIETLKRHLTLKSAVWDKERCASLRYIGSSYKILKNYEEAIKYYRLAILECPNNREPYYDLAFLFYERKKYLECASVLEAMLNIKERDLSYISMPNCWDESVYDLLALCYYYLKDKKRALKNSEFAISMNPTSQRLLSNHKIYEKM